MTLEKEQAEMAAMLQADTENAAAVHAASVKATDHPQHAAAAAFAAGALWGLRRAPLLEDMARGIAQRNP